MTEQGPKAPSAADAAIAEALKSVERLEKASAAGGGEFDDLDPDSVEVLTPGDAPPSADPDAVSDAPPLRTGDDEELLEIEDDADAPAKASPQDAMLQAMIAAKNEAVEALTQTQKEASSLRERLLRTAADFENYKKRQAREKEDAIRFANENLLKELMPVLDNMERAAAISNQSLEGPLDENAVKTLVEGVEMVLRQFADILKKFGIESFSALGERFDPALHEAVAQREDPSVPAQTVIEEYQRGYMLHGRLARPAMVIVATGGPKPPKAAPASEAPVEPDASGDDLGVSSNDPEEGT